jgi:hypothetical protein
MSLRDRGRAGAAFDVDEAVGRALAAWGKARDSDLGRLQLARAVQRMRPEQRAQLADRLAEISLALLFVLERTAPSVSED